MEINRLKHTIRLWLTLGSGKRTQYLREKKVFASIGENCSIMDRKVPLYANLIRIGNNVHIASKVDFITHDITHVVLNNLPKFAGGGTEIQEKIGCIEIKDNVFIGSNTTVLGGVRIGKNVIVAAGSLVNKDVPDNSIVAGIPARVVGSFEDFVNKRMAEERWPEGMKLQKQTVPPELAEYFWEQFHSRREER